MEEKRLIIVGTAHVSKKSVEEVREVIENERPDAVAVELCPRRYHALVHGQREEVSIAEVIKSGNVFMLIFQLILAYFQRKVGEETGVKPGGEMLAAIQKAREVGADVILIDRDIGLTFKRFWQKLSFFEKIKLIVHLIRSSFSGEDIEVDEMLEEDILDMLVKEFRKISPNAAKVLIDERDVYMAANLLNALSRYNKIVAVVGAGHRKGIENALLKLKNNPVDLRELEEVKSGRNYLKISMGAFTALIIATFVLIATSLNTEVLIRAFLYWFLINGILSAIGAAIARGHPLSIITAFLCAWMTSLNPMIAAGWVSGLVEAWIRKPTVEDFSKLVEANSFREMLRNRFFRVLLVAALTNVGSMIGTIYGGWYILSTFGVDVAKVVGERVMEIIGGLV
ncbi:MAG: TraB family protein [Archaeoglobus sp.]|uniref:TraB/GumN family protein n=1 Tax=Archaeoglobus sp. TaxID=1872626 RepID=UPI001DC2CDDC|nr:TraB family protein [Archaeoglobus sp.]MBO8180679.1 TraB family protein [Archaeoglobus sp.]